MKSDKSSGNFFTFAFGKDSTKYYFLRVRGADVCSAITQGSWNAESAVTGSVEAGVWHHYDLVFDGASMTVYVDGAKLGENASLSTTVADLGTGLSGYLGKSLYAADGYFQGSFDDVKVYNRALSASEILTRADAFDQLIDVSLADPAALKLPAIVDATEHTAVFPVAKGTEVSALAPTFAAAEGVTVLPASGTVVDLSSPVEYTLTAPDGSKATWMLSTQVITLDGENGNVPWASGNAWAPTIIERDGKYYFYFSGHNPSVNRKTIGVAVADSPEGPFVAEPEAMIFNNEEVTSGQAIDPAAFRDPETGVHYLAWGNGGNAAVIAELNDDMISLKTGSYQRITGLNNFREGVFLNYRDGIYHVTYSIDDTGSENYRVGYATADSIDGPWTYRGVILEKDLALGIKGPGHSSIINVPGTDDWYIAYHRFALPDGDGTHRETTIDRLTIGEDGLFQKVVPTLTSVGPQAIGTQLDVSASASLRCVAGKTVVVVSVTNDSDRAVTARVDSDYGAKTVVVEAGRKTSVSFSTRLAEIPAGALDA